VRVYQFRHTGPTHDPEKHVPGRSRFSDTIMRQEALLYIYIFVRWRRPCDWSGRLAIYRIALASARRTGKLPQSTVMELREWMARQAK
jgi:hypothetical protein